MIRTLLLSTAACAAAVALTGCGGAGGATATTATVTTTVTDTVTQPPATVTVTASPAAPTGSDPISADQAYAMCFGFANPNFDPQSWTVLPYSPDKNPPAGAPGAWTKVRVGYSSTSGGPGAAYDCAISGTLDAPTVTTNGPFDFG